MVLISTRFWFKPPASESANNRRRPAPGVHRRGDDMLQDGAAGAASDVNHLIVQAQQPTIVSTLDVQSALPRT
jgi:hypothetical protein